MAANIIRLTLIYFSTIIMSLKFINYHMKSRIYKIILLFLPFVLSITSNILKESFIELTYSLPLLLLWILISRVCTAPQASFVSLIVAFVLSYGIYVIASFIPLIFIFPIASNPSRFPHYLLATLTAFFHILFTFFLCRIKRLSKGIPFLFLNNVINVATYICILFIAFLTFLLTKNTNKTSIVLSLFAVVFVLAFLIHWWQAQITKSYRHSLQLRELESLRIELQEKDKQLKEISENNKQMGHVIHEDTKLLRTLLSGIEDYVAADFDDDDARRTKGNALLEVINNHSDERLNTIRSMNSKECKSYSTSIEALNLQLNHFTKRAAAEAVTLHIHIACDLEKYIPNAISTTDLSHLLSNLLDNAFIATSYVTNRVIQLQFYEVNKRFVIEIADSGIPFEVKSLVNFGLTQLTTHEHAGGSGIGLMEIWKIKENLGATLHIEEYEMPSPYTKKISITFNQKNRFSIRTWRKDNIQQASKRIDLQIYDASTF